MSCFCFATSFITIVRLDEERKKVGLLVEVSQQITGKIVRFEGHYEFTRVNTRSEVIDSQP